jgi:hypothetical protein
MRGEHSLSTLIDSCWMAARRRASIVLPLAFVSATAAGCSEILGLEERPVDDGPTVPRDGRMPDARADGPTLAPNDVGVSDTPADLDGADAGIDCLGARRDAYYCDDFNGPTLAPAWQAITTAAESSVGTATRSSVPGRLLATGFNGLPTTGESKVRFLHPTPGGGPVALRFSFYLEDDSYPQEKPHKVASLKTAGVAEASVVFVATDGNGNGKLELRFEGTTLDLGATIKSTLVCYQLVFDGQRVRAFRGNDDRGSAAMGTPVTAVELGMEWSHGTGGSSVFFYYDDVIIAPAAVSCP